MTFANGVASFTLKHGESKAAAELPNGVRYTVAEADYTSEGYVTTKTGNVGTIVGDDTLGAAFTNTKNKDEKGNAPTTGVNNNMGLWLGIMIAAAICLAALLFIKKNNMRKKGN